MTSFGKELLGVREFFGNTIESIFRKTLYEENIKKPLTSKSTISISELPYMCARQEALCLVNNFERKKIIPENLKLTFEMGNAFQDLFRDKISKNAACIVGMWLCENCGHVHGSTDGEFTLNERGAKEASLHKRVPRPSICGLEIEGYGKCEGTDFEYIEETLSHSMFKIKGHPDGFLQNQIYDHVLEIKTTNHRRYYIAKKAPFPEHVEQAMLYAWLALKENIIIFYVNKNTGECAMHRMKLSMEIITKATSRLHKIWSVVREYEKTGKIETLPDRICSSEKDTKAKYCENCTQCFSVL